MLTYVNGEFYPADNAKISVRDRGFRLGDGAFETILIHAGMPYQLALHVERFKKSLKHLGIKSDTKKIPELVKKIIAKNKILDGFVRIAVTRGESGFGYSAKNVGSPTIVIETEKSTVKKNKPAKLWMSSYVKHPLPGKIIGNITSVLARIEAEESCFTDSLLLDAKGKICETSSANIFWFTGNKLYTPKSGMLEGTMRSAVIRLSPFPIMRGDFILADLKKADAVFITNVAWKILPVVELKPLGLKWKESKKTKILAQLLEEDINGMG